MDELKSQESESLDIIESLLDVADMKCTGPLYADDPPRSGICRIPEDDAAKLRQYIAYRRAAPENKSLMCAGCDNQKHSSKHSAFSYEDCMRCQRHWPDRYTRKPERSEKP